MTYSKVTTILVLKSFNNEKFVTADEAYKLLEVAIDRPHFDKILRDLKNRSQISEHGSDKGKYKVTTLGEHTLLTLQRESERLADARPIRQPKIADTIQAIKSLTSATWKYISENPIISAIIAGLIVWWLIAKFS